MDELFSALQMRIPSWRGQPLAVAPLSGGITNHNYKVRVADEHFVVRVCSPGVALHGINRQVELDCAQAAAADGVTPAVIGLFGGLPGGKLVFVTRFINGRTLTADDVCDKQRLPHIVSLLQRTHRLAGFVGGFDVFDIFAQGLAFCRHRSVSLPVWIDKVEARLQQIASAVQHRQLSPAACHNDLLPGNLLEQEDGRLWLVDWEYAGWGDRFFDLGNLAVNNNFGEAEDETLLNLYFGAVTPTDWARLQLMKVVSDAREGIWGLVQTQLSTLEFDYLAYGTDHLEGFWQNSSQPMMTQWLETVQL